MQEWPDDKLDAFFRKLSEEQDPKFEPKDWESLKNRLDEADGKSSPWWKTHWKGALLATLLLISASSLFFLFNEDLFPLSGIETQKTDNKDFRILPEPGDQNQRLEEKQVQTAAGAELIPATAIPKNTSTGTSPDSWISKRRSRQSSNTGGEVAATGVRGTPSADETHLFSSPDKSVQFLRMDAPERDLSSTVSESANQAKLSLLALPAMSQPDPIPPLEISIAGKAQETPLPDELSQQDRRWALRLGAGPDFSSVGLSRLSNPTFAWATHLDYRIAGKLWFQTGYVKSNKKYHAQAGKYTWPSRWYQDVLPESVDATCDMIEIPLTFKYAWRDRDKSSSFVSIGATNYQMKKEQYNYNYEKDDPSIKWRRWQGSTGWYWLSHVHVSVGYERKLNQNWRIGIEPFVKIPTRKVGYGNVNLYTTGAWMYLSFGR